MNDLILAANGIALLVVLSITIFRLNIMTHMTTRLSLRLAYIALSIGALAALFEVVAASWQGALLHAGIAAVLLTDARKSRCYEPDRECDA
ncbi:MAG: hypothetical protein WC100_00965 [Sterolibacterium sp.]